jgi:hypothetical protein
MHARYLEVTFRKGKPLAAYLYFPRAPGVRSARTQAVAPGMLADFAAGGELIGLEFTVPSRVTADQVNAILRTLGVATIAPEELAPLQAA